MSLLAIVTKNGDFNGAVIEVYETYRDSVGGYIIKELSRSKVKTGSHLCFKNEDVMFVTLDKEVKHNDYNCPFGLS